MPLSLPGLFNFTTGVDSAINQQSLRANAASNEALSFVNQLNAFNTALNTNDNLEFRRDFAQQPQGTNILDRFTNIASQTNNPFTLNQAVTQQQSLAPLLALNAVQNPFFAQQQGLPNTAQGALNQGFLGFNPIFQQQSNQQIQDLLAFSNQAPSAPALGAAYQQAQLQALQNQGNLENQQALERERERNRQQQQEIDKLTRLNSQARASTPNTAAPTNPTSNLPMTRGN